MKSSDPDRGFPGDRSKRRTRSYSQFPWKNSLSKNYYSPNIQPCKLSLFDSLRSVSDSINDRSKREAF